MAEVLKRPLLSFLLERLKRCTLSDSLVVATTTHPHDKQIVDLCRKEEVSFFLGDEYNVLDRYYLAANHYNAEVIVRITGDNPLADPALIDAMLQVFFDSYPKYDYLSNVIARTYPRGLDVEIFSMQCLEHIKKYATTPGELEHVTTYVLHHPDRFTTYSFTQSSDLSHYRWTVDTEDDLTLIKNILEALYPQNILFTTQDIMKLLNEHPEWEQINAHVKQKMK